MMWRGETGLVEMLFTYIASIQEFESYENWRPVLVDILSCHEESRRCKETVIRESIKEEVRDDQISFIDWKTEDVVDWANNENLSESVISTLKIEKVDGLSLNSITPEKLKFVCPSLRLDELSAFYSKVSALKESGNEDPGLTPPSPQTSSVKVDATFPLTPLEYPLNTNQDANSVSDAPNPPPLSWFYPVPAFPEMVMSDLRSQKRSLFLSRTKSRVAIIDTLHNDLRKRYQILYPTRHQYRLVCSSLVAKYPVLMDTHPSGYYSWVESLRGKFKRERMDLMLPTTLKMKAKYRNANAGRRPKWSKRNNEVTTGSSVTLDKVAADPIEKCFHERAPSQRSGQPVEIQDEIPFIPAQEREMTLSQRSQSAELHFENPYTDVQNSDSIGRLLHTVASTSKSVETGCNTVEEMDCNTNKE